MAVYLPELEVLFVHVPKTGGMWVKKVLRASGLKVEDAHGPGSHGLPSMYRDRGRRFCFVRQPHSWYESVWRGLQSSWPDRREVLPLHQERTWSPIRMLTYLAGEKTFPKFCEAIQREQPGFASRMFEWYIGPPGAPQVDAVGRMEKAAADLQIILEHFGFKGKLADVAPENQGPSMNAEWLMFKWLDADAISVNRFYKIEGPFFLTK